MSSGSLISAGGRQKNAPGAPGWLQSVKHPALGFWFRLRSRSQGREIELHIRLCTGCGVCLRFFLSFSWPSPNLCGPYPPFFLSQRKKKKKRSKEVSSLAIPGKAEYVDVDVGTLLGVSGQSLSKSSSGCFIFLTEAGSKASS